MTAVDANISARTRRGVRLTSMLLSTLFGVLLVVLFVRSAQVAVTIPPSFDGAMNLQVAASLANGEGYRRNYAAREVFPHEIQTGPPYVLPAAAVFRMFGVGIAQAEVVSIAYVGLLLLAVCLLVEAQGGLPLALFAACTVLLVPGVSEYGFFGYGEIPALAWALLAIVAYFRAPVTVWTALLSGVLLAFAVYTKTVMLIGAGALGLCALLELLSNRRAGNSAGVRRFVAFLCGGAAIIVVMETWRAVALGGWYAWGWWWHVETRAVFMQAGVKAGLGGETHSLAQKFAVHFGLLGHDYRMSFVLVAIWLCALVAAFAIAVWRLRLRRRLNWATLAVLVIGGLYLAWWLLLTPTPKAWHRRILDGMLAADIAVLMVAAPWLRDAHVAIKARSRLLAVFGMGVAVLLPAMWLVKGVHTLLVAPLSEKSCALDMANGQACARFNPTSGVQALQQVAREVRGLPTNAYVFAFGWYSAPRVGLFAQRHILDFHDVPIARMQPGRPVYFVQGASTPSDSLDRIRTLYDVTPAPERGYALVRMTSPTPRPIVAGKTPILRYIHAADKYTYLRGFNQSEGANGRWLTDDNLVLLTPQPRDRFELVAYVLAASQYEGGRLPNVLVSFDGCRAHTQPTLSNQINRLLWRIPERCGVNRGTPVTVRVEVDNLVDNAITRDPRALGVLAKSFGFVPTTSSHIIGPAKPNASN